MSDSENGLSYRWAYRAQSYRPQLCIGSYLYMLFHVIH
ncbi:hypothetical protein PRUPE_2G081300 [Prunus persica]|uniref:Uncharacterized protein n=1 Tax=Prunus persica TaxID=3760 RepID=A0A251QE66_PRUPE|nr:hypothetical protein PRUPE_2G081300 [Prunus persica]